MVDIKNMIESLREYWLRAHRRRETPEFGPVNSQQWKDKMMEVFPFYFQLEPIWGKFWVKQTQPRRIPSPPLPIIIQKKGGKRNQKLNKGGRKKKIPDHIPSSSDDDDDDYDDDDDDDDVCPSDSDNSQEQDTNLNPLLRVRIEDLVENEELKAMDYESLKSRYDRQLATATENANRKIAFLLSETRNVITDMVEFHSTDLEQAYREFDRQYAVELRRRTVEMEAFYLREYYVKLRERKVFFENDFELTVDEVERKYREGMEEGMKELESTEESELAARYRDLEAQSNELIQELFTELRKN
jgi:hypothetical protein